MVLPWGVLRQMIARELKDVCSIMGAALGFCSDFHDYLVMEDAETANETEDFDQCSSLISLIMHETHFERHELFFEQNENYVYDP